MIATDEAPRWELELPLNRPLSLNDREHRAPRAAKVRRLREDVVWLCRQQRIPRCQRIRVGLTYTPPDDRRRDADNLVATLKAACDGLVDAEVVVDDAPHYMEKLMPVVGPANRDRLGLLVLQIWRLDGGN